MTPANGQCAWSSSSVRASSAWPGVEFVVGRMTFGRRLELMRRVRDLAARLEFFEAGREARNEMEASLLGGRSIRFTYCGGLRKSADSTLMVRRRRPSC